MFSLHVSVLSCHFSLLPQSKGIQSEVVALSLPVGVRVCRVSSVIDWRPVQGVPRLWTNGSLVELQLPHNHQRKSGTADGWMDGCLQPYPL